MAAVENHVAFRILPALESRHLKINNLLKFRHQGLEDTNLADVTLLMDYSKGCLQCLGLATAFLLQEPLHIEF